MDGTLQRYKCHKISFSTTVHKTSLLYKCTQNQFTVQVYTKLVYWLRMKGMYKDRTLRNVHGRNITKVRLFELCAKYVQTVTVQVYTKLVYCTSVSKNCVQTGWHKEKFSFGDRHTDTLDFALLELLLRS